MAVTTISSGGIGFNLLFQIDEGFQPQTAIYFRSRRAQDSFGIYGRVNASCHFPLNLFLAGAALHLLYQAHTLQSNGGTTGYGREQFQLVVHIQIGGGKTLQGNHPQ